VGLRNLFLGRKECGSGGGILWGGGISCLEKEIENETLIGMHFETDTTNPGNVQEENRWIAGPFIQRIAEKRREGLISCGAFKGNTS